MSIRECIPRLVALGISDEDAAELRRISMTLHRWHELECGNGNGCIERPQDGTGKGFGKPYWHNSHSGRYTRIDDLESGALKRLAKIMSRYPALGHYIQGDPRGCALYILRPGDVPEGERAESYYSRGVAVFK